MPIYEYRCETCEKLTEAIQKLDEPPLALCPHCGGRLNKLMSAPSFQFKGTGWYVTDYAGKKGPGKGDEAPDGKGSGKEKSGKEETGEGESAKKEVGSVSAKADKPSSPSTS